MSILIDRNTRLIVQGITGSQGSFHTKLMQEYGTNSIAGVTPGKGGTEVCGIPVCDTVREAMQKYRANASVIFVPPRARTALTIPRVPFTSRVVSESPWKVQIGVRVSGPAIAAEASS